MHSVCGVLALCVWPLAKRFRGTLAVCWVCVALRVCRSKVSDAACCCYCTNIDPIKRAKEPDRDLLSADGDNGSAACTQSPSFL